MFGIVHIPTTSDASDGKSTYTVFNIHLNGAYHNSLRYSQLLAFQQEVRSTAEICIASYMVLLWFIDSLQDLCK